MGATAVFERFGYAYPAWSDRPAPVLRDVDLELGPGLTIVAGDSGAGKSTLLRALNGLVPHFHGGRVTGAVTVAGLDVLRTPTRRLARHVGFVFQETEAAFVRGTVAREVAFGPENLGLPPADVRRHVGAALEQAGIARLAGRRLASLSGGERQRVALAAALAASPQVIAMDEPLSQLDAHGTTALAATLAELAGRGRTVVVAEHRVGALAGAGRVVTVAEGRVAEGRVLEGRVVEGRVAEAARPVAPAATAPGAPPAAPHDLGGPPVWALRQVTVGVARRPLLEAVDLAGAAGEVLVVTGPNGAGKTTLLRTIAGLTPPLAGRLERRPGRVAYLPQDPGLLLHRHSVRAEVDQTLRWSGAPGGADPLLAQLGLTALAGRDPRDLSGGQRQRAALAAVLAGRPALALLDEPTRGMDHAARRALAATLHRLAGEGTAVVLATHDQHLAAELSSRVVRIEGGALRPQPAGAHA